MTSGDRSGGVRRPFLTTAESSKPSLFRTQFPTRSLGSLETQEASQYSGPDINLLKCQICLHFPRKQVFICPNGHSVCHVCFLKIKLCPTCRTPYRFGPIRNYAIEALLDSMKFPCEWKDEGCLQKGFRRSCLIAHVAQCPYNPEAVQLCKISRLSIGCSSKFSPKAMLEDSDQVKHLMIHMSYCHGAIKNETTTQKSSSHKIHHWHNWSNTDSNQISYIFSLTDHLTGRTLGVYMVFVKLDLGLHGRLLSWNLVSLVGPPQQQQQITADFYLMKNKRSKSKIRPLWGTESVPSMMWSVKSMDITKYHDFVSLPLKQRLERIFTVPLTHLETYYVEDESSAELTWHITFQCKENAVNRQ